MKTKSKLVELYKAARQAQMKEFGEFLCSLRKQKGDSVRDVAAATGLSNPYLYQIEKGKKALTDPIFIKKLADHFGVKVEAFLEKSGYLPSNNPNADVERDFLSILNKIGYKNALRVDQEATIEVKRFVCELYNKLTEKKLR